VEVLVPAPVIFAVAAEAVAQLQILEHFLRHR
jgi:hypothetical protein